MAQTIAFCGGVVEQPDVWIVVVWDCASVHLNQDVFTHARRLGILVLFVPAGLTHRLLQILDVYIHACLKRLVREHMFGLSL